MGLEEDRAWSMVNSFSIQCNFDFVNSNKFLGYNLYIHFGLKKGMESQLGIIYMDDQLCWYSYQLIFEYLLRYIGVEVKYIKSG